MDTLTIRIIESEDITYEDADIISIKAFLSGKLTDLGQKKAAQKIAWGDKHDIKYTDSSDTLVLNIFGQKGGQAKLLGDVGIPLQDILEAELGEFNQVIEITSSGKPNGKLHIEAHSKGSRRLSIQALSAAKKSLQQKIEKEKDKSSKDIASSAPAGGVGGGSIGGGSGNVGVSANSGGATITSTPKEKEKDKDKDKEKSEDKEKKSKGTKVKDKKKTTDKTLSSNTSSTNTTGNVTSSSNNSGGREPMSGSGTGKSKTADKTFRGKRRTAEVIAKGPSNPSISDLPSISSGTFDASANEDLPAAEPLSLDQCLEKIANGDLSVQVLTEVKRLLSEDGLNDFITQGGFFLLFSNFINAKFKPNTEAVQVIILEILNTYITDKTVYAKVILESPNTVKTIIIGAESEFSSVKSRTYVFVAQVLSMTTRIDSAGPMIRGKVLEALEYYKGKASEGHRFEHLIENFKIEGTTDMRIAVLKIVNSLIGLTEDTEERMSLRSEFVGLGLELVLEEIKKNDLEEGISQIHEQIQIYEAARAADEMVLRSFLSSSLALFTNLNASDDKSLALLCASLIQRFSKNEWLRRTGFDILGRLVCMQADSKIGLAKWQLLYRVMMQFNQDKQRVLFDNGNSIDISLLLESVKDYDLGKAVGTAKVKIQAPEEQLEQLKFKFNRLEKELNQLKENAETLRLEKDVEIEDLKKVQQQFAQQSSDQTGGNTQNQSDEQQYEEFHKKRALERSHLQEERLELDLLMHKLHEERSQLLNLSTYLKKQFNVEVGIGPLKETAKSVNTTEAPISDEQHETNISVIKEWLDGLLQIDLSKENLPRELMDGTILCKAMNALQAGYIKKFYPNPKVTILKIENIGFFLNACESELGFSPFQLFRATDLVDDGKNIKKVFSVLVDIMKAACLKDFSEV